MRKTKFAAIAVVAIALVFSSVPMAFAQHGDGHRGRSAPYRVSRPHLADERVTMGVSFDATGVLTPAIAADDASTTVALEVYGPAGHGRPALLESVPAALSASPDTGTVYAATLTLSDPGRYLVVAAVSRDGSVIARSKSSEVRIVLPYRLSKPRVVSSRVLTGTSFDATGVVVPAIAADDASTTVSVLVFQTGRRHSRAQVAEVAATLTGAVGGGTGYSASLTLPTAGEYVLVAVVMRDGVVLGRSPEREVRAADVLPAPPRDHSRGMHRH
jgi:hypothetical protein